MPTPSFISIFDHVLSAEECSSALSFFLDQDNLQPAPAGGITDKSQKDGRCLPLSFDSYDKNSEQMCNLFRSRVETCIRHYTKIYPELHKYISFWRLDPSFHMQEFPENGGCFIPHCEQGGVPVARRIISWMIYLNNARSGTYFLFQDQTIEASQGKVVIWPAAWTHIHHGVIPNQDKKYIVSGWCSFYSPSAS